MKPNTDRRDRVRGHQDVSKCESRSVKRSANAAAMRETTAEAASGFIVWDCRTGNVQPAIGAGDNPAERVYDEQAAIEYAVTLNCYVLRNTNPALAALVADGKAQLKGPFYVHPASKRAFFTGHTIGGTRRS